ncbi:Uncharacterised protein [Neisseria gonorrhoeae]|uniref:Uncharacterized protein n=1 Tax=Neisseria gonorrhoeae TaxID=485 RepID=A0A379B1N4_NEIGO|nr:Uncharacterised protein [Neisseria gonorrhoeae]
MGWSLRIASCSLTSALRFFATINKPLVSLSKRWTNSKYFASGRARRNCSITPKLTPLPPCTATPEGLLTTSSASSSYTTSNARAGTAARLSDGISFSATRTGGIRTVSPSAIRLSGLQRFLFNRTSPARIMRWI